MSDIAYIRGSMSEQPVLVEATRGRIAESYHRGSIAVVEPDGDLVASAGHVDLVTYMRSTAKPIQMLPLLISGAADRFGFTESELAIIAASHSGEPIHTEQVESILQKIGLDKSNLHCGVHPPFDKQTQQKLAGQTPDVLQNNCSGKHSGMLAQCVAGGYPVDNYESPDHPIQVEIRKTIALFCGVDADSIEIGVDGCSAPVFGVPVSAIARAYAQLVNPVKLGRKYQEACKRVVDAMLNHPELVAGTRNRVDTDIMRVCDHSVIAKVGAEGVYAMGILPNRKYKNGLGIAIKIEDGNDRATAPAAVETLDRLGLLSESQQGQLSCWQERSIKNHSGSFVGELRPAFELDFEL